MGRSPKQAADGIGGYPGGQVPLSMKAERRTESARSQD